MPPAPLEARAFGPSIYRAARLIYNENPPTSKLNETPDLIIPITWNPDFPLGCCHPLQSLEFDLIL